MSKHQRVTNMLCATSPFWNLTCWLCGHTLLRQVYCSITCPSLADWKFDGLYHVPWFFVSCRTAIWHWDIWYLSHLLPLATLALGYCPLLPSILHYHMYYQCVLCKKWNTYDEYYFDAPKAFLRWELISGACVQLCCIVVQDWVVWLCPQSMMLCTGMQMIFAKKLWFMAPSGML